MLKPLLRALTGLLAMVAAALALVGPAAAAPSGTVDLYVFAGQSNMRGVVDRLTSLSMGPTLIPEPYKTLYANPVDWAWQWNNSQVRPTATDATSGAVGGGFRPYRAGYDPSDPRGKRLAPWGPEVAFLAKRHQADGRPLYFVKYAIGGTALAYAPTSTNWNVQATGTRSLLQALVARVAPARDWLLAQGASHVAIHLLWAQGESDAGALGRCYAENFAAFRTALAAALTRDNASVTIDSMTLVANLASRNAQAQINIAASEAGTQLVNVHDFPTTLFISDKIHLGPAGQVRHGEEMEAAGRSRPRQQLDRRSVVTRLTLRIPVRAGRVAYLPTVADGSQGLQLVGDTSGLALDALTGSLSVIDPALLQPGVRTLILHRHSVASDEATTLELTFVR